MLRRYFVLFFTTVCTFVRCVAAPFNDADAHISLLKNDFRPSSDVQLNDSVDMIKIHIVAATINGKPAPNCRILFLPGRHVRTANHSGNLIIEVVKDQKIFIEVDDERFTKVSLDTAFVSAERVVLALRLAPVDPSFDQPTLRPVHFKFDRSTLSPEFHNYLDRIASHVISQNMRIVISGFTDSFGNPLYNMRLSYRRASRVADYLKLKGVQPGNIKIISKGDADPVEPNVFEKDDNPAGRQANRRVEISLTR